MEPKKARSNLWGGGDRFGDFSAVRRKTLVRADIGRKRLMKKFEQQGKEVPWSCYRREVEEFDRERVRRGIPENAKATAARPVRQMKVRRVVVANRQMPTGRLICGADGS